MHLPALRRLAAIVGVVTYAAAQDAPPLVTLREIQGSGDDVSPYEGQTVRLIATVTAVASHSFFVQDDTMYGVYVYERTIVPAVGDEVELVGEVSEFNSLTELFHVNASLSSIRSSSNTVPEPVSIRTGDLGERHEGLLVEVTGTCIQHDIGHGEWVIDDGSGPLVVDDMLLDDIQPDYNIIYTLTGIGHFSFDSFKIEATAFTQVGRDPQRFGIAEEPFEPPPPPPPTDQCPNLNGPAFDRRTSRDTLTIGTFNVEWLFDGTSPEPGPSPWKAGSRDCAGLANGLNQCNEAGATAHLERVAAVVARLQPDILNLVEVEGCSILRRLAALLPSTGLQPFLLRGTDTFLGQNAGLLTKLSPAEGLIRSAQRVDYPIPGSECYALGDTGGVPGAGTPTPAPTATSDTGVSKHYKTIFDLDGWGAGGTTLEVAFYGVHFKAIPTQPSSCAQREAQAVLIAQMVALDLAAGREVVVTGDFNDFSADELDVQGNVRMHRSLLPQHWVHNHWVMQVPTSKAVRILQDVDSDGNLDLFNVVGQVPVAERYSDWWDHDTESSSKNNVDDGTAERSELDHMLLTAGLRDRVTQVWIDHGHNPADVSDHWPLMAQLRRQPATVAWGALGDAPMSSNTRPRVLSNVEPENGNGWAVMLVVLIVGIVAAVSAKKWSTGSGSAKTGEDGGIYGEEMHSDVP